jgi:hypothetical protein
MTTAASNGINEDKNKRDTILTKAATPPTNTNRMNSEFTGCLASSSSLITPRQSDEACSRKFIAGAKRRHVEFDARRAWPHRQQKSDSNSIDFRPVVRRDQPIQDTRRA